MISHEEFLQNIKKNLINLKKLQEKVNDHWCYEDLIYRFYHYSFKVYSIQSVTQQIIEELKKLVPPDTPLNSFFENILEEGMTGETFKFEHNKEWLKHTRPKVEAFFHAKYFLEMAVKYGESLEHAPSVLPSGWAGLLYLFNLRYSQ